MEILCYNETSTGNIYRQLAKQDKDLKGIIDLYSYPPNWTRPNSFETLVLTILEQQVSLASAYAAYKKLKDRISITPAALLSLTDEDLRNCYLSRQKIVYTRQLAKAISVGTIQLEKFETQSDHEIRSELKKIKGIGDWTVDIYLIHALRRTDVFPTGDLALVNAVKMVKNIPAITREQLIEMSNTWKPYRSLATMLFWHYYIRKKGVKVIV